MTIRARLLLLLLPPLTAFLILASFFFYFNWSRDILLIGTSLTLLLVIGTVFILADRISKPVRQLNKTALEIAAGDYEANIKVKGPKEITELAHTLNTMSQCLVENMSRLRESSLIRERMYGEYECALLLQHYMLMKVVKDFDDPHLNLRLISLPSSPLQKGLFLLTEYPKPSELNLTLLEAEEGGFPGLFHLNQSAHLPKADLEKKNFIQCQFIDQYRRLRYHHHTLLAPLIWSIQAQQFVKNDSREVALDDQDIVFLYNSNLIEHFETEELVEQWFAKVLRHFAKDGLNTIQIMLTHELTFLAKKQHVKHNFKILGLQLKKRANHSINDSSI